MHGLSTAVVHKGTLLCGAQAPHGGGLPSYGTQTRGPMDFSSCGVRAPHGGGLPSCPADSRACGLQQLWGAGSVPAGCRLWRVGSVAVAPGLSCTEVCGISPDQGLNPRPHINRRILIPCATREVQGRFFSASGETIHSQAVRPPNQTGRGPSACGRPIPAPLRRAGTLGQGFRNRK